MGSVDMGLSRGSDASIILTGGVLGGFYPYCFSRMCLQQYLGALGICRGRYCQSSVFCITFWALFWTWVLVLFLFFLLLFFLSLDRFGVGFVPAAGLFRKRSSS